jgi:hypothetical protein
MVRTAIFRPWWPASLVVLLVGLAYANALPASFQFGDWDAIVRDPAAQSISAWWTSLPAPHPLLTLSYALNHELGAGVTGVHAVNVLIHAGNGLLVLYLVRRFAAQLGDPLPRAGWLALATSLIFVLHPVQTEAVTYASGRSMSLGGLFALASIALWVKARPVPGERSGWSVLLYPGSALLMLAAIGTLEAMVIVPVVLLLWEAADVSRPLTWAGVFRRTAMHWLVCAGALLGLASLPDYPELLVNPPMDVGLASRLTGIRYLAGQLLNIDRLNADPVLPVADALDAAGSITLVVLVVAGGLALTTVRRYPMAAFAVLWFLLWLVAVNVLLTQADMINDRHLYLALAGPALLLAAAIRRLAVRQPQLAVTALVAVLALAGFATHLRNEVYRDELSFWRDVVEQSPDNPRAFSQLGRALAGECDLRRAEAAWQRALAIDRGYAPAADSLRLLSQGNLPDGLGPCPEQRRD